MFNDTNSILTSLVVGRWMAVIQVVPYLVGAQKILEEGHQTQEGDQKFLEEAKMGH